MFLVWNTYIIFLRFQTINLYLKKAYIQKQKNRVSKFLQSYSCRWNEINEITLLVNKSNQKDLIKKKLCATHSSVVRVKTCCVSKKLFLNFELMKFGPAVPRQRGRPFLEIAFPLHQATMSLSFCADLELRQSRTSNGEWKTSEVQKS